MNVAKDVGKDKVGVVDKHAWVEAAKAGNVEELKKLAQQEMKSSQGLHQAILEYINQFKEAIKINL